MNRAITLTISLLLAAISLFSHAYDFKTYGIAYNILSEDDRTVAVTYLSEYNPFPSNSAGYSGAITIPSRVINNSKTYKVVEIDSYAFYKCHNLTEIGIPNSITSIGSHAFTECESLSKVTIPNSVTHIGSGAFSVCI